MNERAERFEGRTQAFAALRALLQSLPDAAPRRLWLVDFDYAEWPLDEGATLRALTQWVCLPGRRATWIAADFEPLERRCPRLAAWRRDYAHAIDAWRPGEGECVAWPAWLMSERGAVVFDERSRWRGRLIAEPAALREMREVADALLQRCEPAWAGRVLGL